MTHRDPRFEEHGGRRQFGGPPEGGWRGQGQDEWRGGRYEGGINEGASCPSCGHASSPGTSTGRSFASGPQGWGQAGWSDDDRLESGRPWAGGNWSQGGYGPNASLDGGHGSSRSTGFGSASRQGSWQGVGGNEWHPGYDSERNRGGYGPSYAGNYGGSYGPGYSSQGGPGIGQDLSPEFGGGQGRPGQFSQQGSSGYGYQGIGGSPSIGTRGQGPKGYKRSDDRIREDLSDRLMQVNVDAGDVSIQVRDGEVTLEGTVNDRSTKRRIEDLAEGVLGASQVNNHLRVQSSSASSRGRERDEESGSQKDRDRNRTTGTQSSRANA